MWSNTDNGQLEICAQVQIWSTRKMWSNTDNGQLEICDQIQKKVKERCDQLERCDQIQIKFN